MIAALLVAVFYVGTAAVLVAVWALVIRDMADGVWDDDDRWAWSTDEWARFDAACREWSDE